MDLYQSARQGFAKTLGEDHPNTMSATLSVGHALKSLGRFAEAHSLYQEALRGYRQVLGDQHPFTVRAVNLLGELDLQVGQLDEARTCFEESLSTSRQSLGEDHLETVRSMINMGTLLSQLRRFEEAEPILRDAASKAEKLPPAHEQRSRAIASLIKLYETMDNGLSDGPYASLAAEWRSKQDVGAKEGNAASQPSRKTP